ncbi:GNAT family N-acetyltransferase [Candidatus Minimicrobia naudis]
MIWMIQKRELMEEFLKRNPTTCFVAVEESEIAGAIIAGHDGRRGRLYHTTTDEQCRGRRVGGSWLNQPKSLRRRGITKVELFVFNRNRRGQKVLEKMGFAARTPEER